MTRYDVRRGHLPIHTRDNPRRRHRRRVLGCFGASDDLGSFKLVRRGWRGFVPPLEHAAGPLGGVGGNDWGVGHRLHVHSMAGGGGVALRVGVLGGFSRETLENYNKNSLVTTQYS